jgi:enoyl-CoA hydratase/carnithine racemase
VIENIKSTYSDSILCLQIHRPEKRNAITPDIYSSLVERLKKGDEDEAVKVVVLHGTHNCFTSGNDLNAFRNGPVPDKQYPHNVFLSALSQTKKPVIAAVNGPALGIGTIMLMHCDLVYAATDARFSFPFINLGLSPEGATSYLLPRLVGYRKAMEMVLFGEQFGVVDAQEIGLINELVLETDVFVSEQGEIVSEQSVVFERAMERARFLSNRSSGSVQAAKALLKSSTSDAIAQAMGREQDVFSERLASDEAQTAIAGFFGRKS